MEWRINYNGTGWTDWRSCIDDDGMMLKQLHGDHEPYWVIEFRTGENES